MFKKPLHSCKMVKKNGDHTLLISEFYVERKTHNKWYSIAQSMVTLKSQYINLHLNAWRILLYT